MWKEIGGSSPVHPTVGSNPDSLPHHAFSNILWNTFLTEVEHTSVEGANQQTQGQAQSTLVEGATCGYRKCNLGALVYACKSKTSVQFSIIVLAILFFIYFNSIFSSRSLHFDFLSQCGSLQPLRGKEINFNPFILIYVEIKLIFFATSI